MIYLYKYFIIYNLYIYVPIYLNNSMGFISRPLLFRDTGEPLAGLRIFFLRIENNQEEKNTHIHNY